MLASLVAKINDGRALWLGRWEAPTEFREFVLAIFEPADHRGTIGWPDVIARLEVRDRVRPCDGDAGLGERREIVRVGDVVSEVVAHVGVPARSFEYPAIWEAE